MQKGSKQTFENRKLETGILIFTLVTADKKKAKLIKKTSDQIKDLKLF